MTVRYKGDGGSGEGGGGEQVHLLSTVNPALQLTNQVAITAATILPGIDTDINTIAFLGELILPSIDIDLISTTGALATTTLLPAMTFNPVISEYHLDTTPAADIIQITYNLNRRVGGDVAANVTGTWTTLANAEGIHDGSDATSTGAAVGATRKMSLSYANHVNKSELVISSAKLFLYIQSVGNTAGLLGNISMAYNIGAGEVNPVGWLNRTDTFDFTTTPAEVDITTPIGGDWAKLDALQTFVTHVYGAASTTFVCRVDAIELEVIATKTDTL